MRDSPRVPRRRRGFPPPQYSGLQCGMAESSEWAFPAELQPRAEDLRFDLDAALDSLVLVRAEVPEDAFTAAILGTERIGNGVVIGDDGLVLTIGYLITEATAIWLTTNQGAAVAGYPLAYDQATGFGLVQPLGRSVRHRSRAAPRPTSASATPWSSPATAAARTRSRRSSSPSASSPATGNTCSTRRSSPQPAHPQWGGAALIGARRAPARDRLAARAGAVRRATRCRAT